MLEIVFEAKHFSRSISRLFTTLNLGYTIYQKETWVAKTYSLPNVIVFLPHKKDNNS